MEKINQKAGVVILAAILMIITIVAILWIFNDSKTVLFSGLSEKTLLEYTSKLEAEGISYDVNAKASSIIVDASQTNQARVIAMQDSLHNAEITGLELYENSDLGATERAREANYVRALQGEIERTLTSYNYVKRARVHLSIPKKRLFSTESNSAKASVTLFLVDGYNPRNSDIHSIKQLVSSAVENLGAENVVVLDGTGNWGAMTASTMDASHPALSLRKSTEEYLERKVYQVLSPMFSADQIAVSVAVELNTDKSKTLETKAIKSDNGESLVNSEVSTEETTMNEAKVPESKTTRREVQYAHGSMTQEIERTPGQIISLSAAVSINAEGVTALKSEIVQLVEHTIGINAERGDKVSVSVFELTSELFAQDIIEQPQVMPPIQAADIQKENLDLSWPLTFLLLTMFFSISGGVVYLVRKREASETLLLTELTGLFEQKEQVNG